METESGSPEKDGEDLGRDKERMRGRAKERGGGQLKG